MRVADKMAFNQVNASLARNRTEMSDLQNQAATQKRINKPSDDPLASARVLAARTEERGASQFIKNTNIAKSFLEYTDQSLGELSEVLVRAKELAISQSSDGGSSAETRLTTASEIEQLHNQSIQIGNRRFGDRYIFAGHQTKQAPFDSKGNYFGDDGDIKIQVQKDASISMNMPGDKVFLGRGVGQDGIIRPRNDSPQSAEDIVKYKENEKERAEKNREIEDQDLISVRGPAAIHDKQVYAHESEGINVLETLKSLEISLRSNDKESVQAAMDDLDRAIQQVVQARSQVGSRVSTLNSNIDSLQKNIVDNKLIASELEDSDTFQVVSDINKTDSTLKATLQTSSKLIQASLLDFLR
jgi:flagellar hook-associated protein 3 FlgL